MLGAGPAAADLSCPSPAFDCVSSMLRIAIVTRSTMSMDSRGPAAPVSTWPLSPMRLFAKSRSAFTNVRRMWIIGLTPDARAVTAQ